MTDRSTLEGFLVLPRARIRYRVLGRGEPIVLLNGGPTLPFDYFLPWVEPLAERHRLVLFDPGGAGASSDATDGRYDLDALVEEVGEVARSLDLGSFHLLGHSAGGFLAQEFALRRPEAVRSMLLLDTFSSTPVANRRLREMLASAPPGARETIRRMEADGSFHAGAGYDPEYRGAVEQAYAPVSFVDPARAPPELSGILSAIRYPVYRRIWGERGEFVLDGSYAGWDPGPARNRAGYPVLVISGRADMPFPEDTVALAASYPRGEAVIFGRSGHYPFIEENRAFLHAVSAFLERAEHGRAPG
jgi:proline iminopeptidase